MSSSQFGGGTGSRKRGRDTSAYPAFVSRKRTKSNKKKIFRRGKSAQSFGLFKANGEGPFPQKLNTTLQYRSLAVQQTGSSVSGTYSATVVLNDLFDFDSSNVLGNKQPLFYDQLFSATGPYTRLECKSWRTRWTIINTGAEPVSIYWNGKGTAVAISEEDTTAEVSNRPNMQVYHLGPKGSMKDTCYIKSSGAWTDHVSEVVDPGTAYNASPGTPIYGTLFANTPTNTTAPTLTIQCDHYFDIVCLRPDAVVS